MRRSSGRYLEILSSVFAEFQGEVEGWKEAFLSPERLYTIVSGTNGVAYIILNLL